MVTDQFYHLQRILMIAFHLVILLLSLALAYGCFLLWQPLLDTGKPNILIFGTLAAAAMAGFSNGVAALRLVRSLKKASHQVTLSYLPLWLGLLLTLAASYLFSGF